MVPKLRIEQAAAIAQIAFAPLECATEFRDSRNKLRISVLDAAGNAVIPSCVLIPAQFRDARRLKSNLSELRRQIERRRKLELAPWKFPEVAGADKAE